MLTVLILSFLAGDGPSFDREAAQKALAAPKVGGPVALKATADFVRVLTLAPATKELPDIAKVVRQLRTKAGMAGDATAARARGHKHYTARNFGLACKSFQAAVNLDPTNAELWADLGLCRFKLGELERGIEASRAAIALGEPTVRKNAYFNLGKFQLTTQTADAAGCDEHYETRDVSWSRHACDTHFCYGGSVTWTLIGRATEELDACAELLTTALEKEDSDRRTSPLLIAAPLLTCTSTVVVDTSETTGGYEQDSPEGANTSSSREKRCRFVYVDACRGLAALACDDGEVRELTP